MISNYNVESFYKNKSTGGWSIAFDGKKCPQALFDEVESALKGNVPTDWIAIKSSMFTRVWKVRKGTKIYVIKEFLWRNPLDPLKATFYGSRAERAWSHGKILIEKGFPTPDVIACGKESTWIFTKRQFIITEFIPDVVGGYEAIRLINKLPLKKRLELKRAIIKSLGKTIAELHSAGIIHGDLRPNNILIEGWDRSKLKFYFIDNERNSIHKNAPLRLIRKNLVQLNMIKLDSLSLMDRFRFFEAYIMAFPELRHKRKALVREVWERTEKRMAKYKGL